MNFAPLLRSPAPRPSKRGAFSLLEVAIALVIFVIGAIALLRIFPTGLNVLEHSGNRRIAAQMSQNLKDSFQVSASNALLPGSIPDAVYDQDPNSTFTDTNWNDYPFSSTGLSRDKGTMPQDADSFGTSGTGHLRAIRGEHQTPVSASGTTSVVTNFIADRGQVAVYREGVVSGVVVDPKTRQLDFKVAKYSQSHRLSLTNLAFREPYISDTVSYGPQTPTPTPLPAPPSPTPAPTPFPAPPLPNKSDGVITIYRALYDTQQQVIFSFNPVAPSDSPTGTTIANVSSSSPVTAPAVSTSTNAVTLTFNIPADTPGAPPQVMKLDLIAPDGISVERRTYAFIFQGSSGGPGSITAGDKLAIRAPLSMRKDVVYYPSPSSATGGVYQQPMKLPLLDTDYKQDLDSPAVSLPSGTTTLQESLFLRQKLGRYGGQGDRITFNIVPSGSGFADASDTFAPNDLTQVALDYSVYDWAFLTEFASQFGTPFPSDQRDVTQTSKDPDDLVLRQFFYQRNQSTQPSFKRSEVAELRTSVGNLRGPIFIKGLYGNGLLSDVRFSPSDLPDNYAVLSPSELRSFRKRMADAAKQGRFYLPNHVTDSSTGTDYPLQSARLYYRSRDGWAQQVSVAASHYIPFDDTAPIREPWREYVKGTDGYLYFHATEAGKNLVYKYTSNSSGIPLEIKPKVQFFSQSELTAILPTSAANFTIAKFQNPANPNDPRNGRFYVAVSRSPVAGAIYDVGRPSADQVSVRTLWLDSGRYAQEVAQ